MKGKFSRTITKSVTLSILSGSDLSLIDTIKVEEVPKTEKAKKDFLIKHGLPADSKIVESSREYETREMDLDTFIIHSVVVKEEESE